MKKIILILCSLSVIFDFISCDNNNEPDNTLYLDNRLVEGTWYSKFAKDSLVYTFKADKLTTEFYAYINGMDELKFDNKENLGSYLLTDSQIILPQRKDLNIFYKIPGNNKDSLYIQENDGYWYGFKKIKN